MTNCKPRIIPTDNIILPSYILDDKRYDYRFLVKLENDGGSYHFTLMSHFTRAYHEDFDLCDFITGCPPVKEGEFKIFDVTGSLYCNRDYWGEWDSFFEIYKTKTLKRGIIMPSKYIEKRIREKWLSK